MVTAKLPTDGAARLEWTEQVLRTLREPLLVASRDGRILAANVASAEMLGKSIEAIVGTSIADYLPDPAHFEERLRDALADVPLTLRATDERRCFCYASALGADLLLLRLSGGPGSEARTRALAELMGTPLGASTEASVSPSPLERLQAFTGALARAITPSGVVEAVVDVGTAATSAHTGGLWLRTDDGAAALARSVGRTGPRPDEHPRAPLEPPGRMPILDAIRTGVPVWIESCADLEKDYPATFQAFSQGGETAIACLPLLAQGRCIGGLVFVYRGAHRFVEDERSFLQLLAWYAAQAVERSQVHAAEKLGREVAEARRRRSEVLADAGALLASSPDAAQTLARAARVVVPRVAGWSIVQLDEGARDRGSPSAVHEDPSKLAALTALADRLSVLGGPVGFSRTRAAELRPQVSLDELRGDLQGNEAIVALYQAVGFASSIVVPIAARGRTLGWIALGRVDPAHPFEGEDLAMAEDLGRRVGLTLDNAWLYQDAREADRLKDDFLAMLGHELRNPLAPIVIALELMDVRGGDAFARERTIIARHVRHVVRLVDDLLDVSRITRGKLQLDPSRWEVAQVIADAVEMASPLIEEKGQHLIVLAPAEGLAVNADRVRLAQAFANLLTNAAKYTGSRGQISIMAEAEGAEVVVRVRDSGVGVAKEALPRIFGLFVQESTSLDRSRGGLGIGLTVVKGVVELHGGSVSAHSEGLGRGTELVVRLPLAGEVVATKERARAASPVQTSVSEHRLRVLVVEDSADAAEVLCHALEALGCEVRSARDAPAALSIAAELQPHVGLLDIGLPETDGYELARQLRKSAVNASMWLVAVTGYGQESDRVRALDAGFDQHLVKPIGLDQVRAVLARALAALTAG